MPSVSRRFEAEQYDGTNGSYLIGTFCPSPNLDLVSDNGTTLVFEDGDNNTHTVSAGDYLVRGSNPLDDFPEVQTPTQYAQNWIPEPVLTLASGYALTPSITGSGGTANVAVDLDTTMSGTGYEATAILAGTSALLADLDITAVAITDNNTVTVTVQNNGALALAGATVIVTAGELV